MQDSLRFAKSGVSCGIRSSSYIFTSTGGSSNWFT